MKDQCIRVGIAQMDCRLGDLTKNMGKHIEFIQAARKAKVEVLLFPELSLTGYAIGPQTVDMSLERDSEYLMELAYASGEMWSLVGFMEEGVAAQFHNSQVGLRNGDIRFIHRKLNLATYGRLEEGKHFASGRYFEGFLLQDKHWKAGVLICSDAWNPGLVHLAAVHGVTIFFFPIASTLDAVDGEFSNPNGWKLVSHFYAMIYGVPILMANHAKGISGLNFWGGSRILNPYGEVLAETGEDEDLLIADVDYEQVKRARYRLPTIRDSNLDLFVRELNRLSRQIGIPPESRRIN